MTHCNKDCWPPVTRADFCDCLNIFYKARKREAKTVTVPLDLWQIWFRRVPPAVARSMGCTREKVPIGGRMFGLVIRAGKRFALA